MKNSNAYIFEPILNIAPGMPPKLLTSCLSINNLNLKRIIYKCMDFDSGYGWDLETALSIADMYRAFLYLCKTYTQQVIVPTREVDDFWHLHLLDTRNYIADCENIFGHYLHHFPYAGLKGTLICAYEEETYLKETFKLIEINFPELVSEKV
ncbi:MAG TPA: hypothetical protein VNJ08_03580 [Bacteriovoracaceae bacterium]|nr:hypothetical protein [Bacteriovoracaceae bacterium]